MNGYSLQGDPFRPPKKKKERSQERRPEAPTPSGPPSVIWTENAIKEYQALSANVKTLIDELAQRLRDWPNVSGIKMIFGAGYQPGKFRMKTWDWRLEGLYSRPTNQIAILRVGHRDTFYDEYHA